MDDLAYKTSAGRLREAGALKILSLYAERKTYQKIAEHMSVSIGTVYNICKGRTWKDLPRVDRVAR